MVLFHWFIYYLGYLIKNLRAFFMWGFFKKVFKSWPQKNFFGCKCHMFYLLSSLFSPSDTTLPFTFMLKLFQFCLLFSPGCRTPITCLTCGFTSSKQLGGFVNWIFKKSHGIFFFPTVCSHTGTFSFSHISGSGSSLCSVGSAAFSYILASFSPLF